MTTPHLFSHRDETALPLQPLVPHSEAHKDQLLDHDNPIPHPDAKGLEVMLWLGEDGVPVIQIDTEVDNLRFRVNVNDAAIWDEDSIHHHEQCDCIVR